MDIKYFLSFKNSNKCQELDNLNLLKFNNFFGPIKKKHVQSSNLHILKNQELQNKKKNVTNKINLILNKVSDSNINNLLDEFIENINYLSQEEYNELQKTFYSKMILEPVFMNIYLNFFKSITHIYNNILKYNISYFISIIETKFKYDYKLIELSNEYLFLKDLSSESNRNSNIQLIYNMINKNILNDTIYNECHDIILNQHELIDIYNWFNIFNNKLSDDAKLKIKNHLLGINKLSREYILLNSLSVPNNKSENISSKKENINTFDLECDNIIDEYLFMTNIEDIKYFIDTRCIDAFNKNILCKLIIHKYFSENNETSTEILNLIKQLILSQHLFKINIVKGFQLLYSSWDNLVIDYNNSNEKMKNILTNFKSLNIVKGLENIVLL